MLFAIRYKSGDEHVHISETLDVIQYLRDTRSGGLEGWWAHGGAGE